MASLLHRLLRVPQSPDGDSDALVAHATGVTPTLLESSLVGIAADAAVPQRRQRLPNHPRTQLAEILGAKALYGWLQNRHQILLPLTLNLRTLNEEQARCLATMTAVAVLAGSRTNDDRRRALRQFLSGVKADDATLTAFDAACVQPPALDTLIAEVERLELGAYAYIVSVVATDRHDPIGQAFAAYIAARLHLPGNVVNSATRRYRR